MPGSQKFFQSFFRPLGSTGDAGHANAQSLGNFGKGAAFEIVGTDNVLLVRGKSLDGLSKFVLLCVCGQCWIFCGHGITVKVEGIIGNMAPGFLVVVVVFQTIQVDDQIPPVICDFDFYGFGGELVFHSHVL